jgi:transcriptional regulator with PAS, ATPase and Fis domain
MSHDFRGPPIGDLSPPDPGTSPKPQILKDASAAELSSLLRERQKELLELERRVVRRALKENGNNRSRAAKALGMNRYALLRWMRRLKIES